MTLTADALAPRALSPVQAWISDCAAVTWRNLVRFKRTPEVLVFAVLQPIMFVLLFSQVYGGSIKVAGTDYTSYLMAGIFGQTVLFGSSFSGMGMAQDLKDGIIDRFRTLPMSHSAVLVGRTLADLCVNIVSMVIMMGTGALVGWRFTNGWPSFLAGVGILLLFAYALSWVMVLVGLVIGSTEALNNATFMIMFPLTFVSNAFVQSQTLPGPLEWFANWNPVSSLVHAARTLFGNTGTAPVPDVWPLQHAVLTSLIGSLALVAIFAPLAMRAFRRATSR